MKVGIMQPYLFPYIGYFQLINFVDAFVFHDDVQFIKGGWINRNRILLNGKDYMFTFSLKKDSSFTNINQRYFTANIDIEKKKFINIIKIAYTKAPFFQEILLLLEKILNYNEVNMSKFIINSLKILCKYMEIITPFYLSSELDKENLLKGEERVIAINKCLFSDNYINPIGGVELYSKEEFANNGIKLNFIKCKNIKYSQFNNNFIPNLSIIDVLMFNSKSETKRLLNEFELF